MKSTIKNFLVSVLALVTGLGLATQAMAAAYSCVGTVTTLGQGQASGDTKVGVSIGTGNAFYLCSLDARGSYQMTVDGCKAAFATMQIAKNVGATVEIYFNNGYSCATIPYGGNMTDAFWINGPL